MPFNIILLTQETGYLDPETGKEIGNRSCALMQQEHERLGNTCTQLKIADCSLNLEKNEFLYGDKPFDLKPYQAVVLRTWGDRAQREKALYELFPFLEEQGLYSDNPLGAMLKTEDKKLMQRAIEESNAPCPRSLVVETYDESITQLFIKKLRDIFIAKTLDESCYPAYVIKPNSGTHGFGIHMFFLGEEKKLIEYLQSLCKHESCILQEYIKPAFLMVEKPVDQACSAHYRIIMSRQVDKTLLMIGGLYLQRTGSWVSNTHAQAGELHKQILRPEHLPRVLLDALTKIADSISINQFGADVVIDDAGKFFILELNNGMGISGPLLESQRIPYHYVSSHVSRLQDHLHSKLSPSLVSSKGLLGTLGFYAPPGLAQSDLSLSIPGLGL